MLILAHFWNFGSSFPQLSREVSHQTPNPSTPDGFGVLSRELIIMFSHKKGGLSKRGYSPKHTTSHILINDLPGKVSIFGNFEVFRFLKIQNLRKMQSRIFSQRWISESRIFSQRWISENGIFSTKKMDFAENAERSSFQRCPRLERCLGKCD